MIKRFLQDEEGLTWIDYSLMIAVIAAVLIAIWVTSPNRVSTVFNSSTPFPSAVTVPAEWERRLV